MLLPYHKVPDNFKVWIYQANRQIEIDELNDINDAIEFFVEEWQQHGEEIRGFSAVYYRRFIVLMADNLLNDNTVNSFADTLRALGNYLDIDFFDNTKICYKIGLQDIADFNYDELETLVIKEYLRPDTIIFDNNVSTKVDFDKKWEIKAVESKFNRYFLQKDS